MHSFLKRYKSYVENKKLNRTYPTSMTRLSSQPEGAKTVDTPNKQGKIEVLQGDHLPYLYTLTASNEQNIGVLNNANLYVAGGGYRFGQLAQEESLCYVSNLYLELTKMRKHYVKNWLHFSLYNSNDLFYHKDITVYRDENLTRLKKPVTIDVVSASAVNRAFLLVKNEQKINAIMKDRIRKILETFIMQGNQTILLNPFGCGAYGNDSHTVATLFHDVLVEENFRSAFDHVLFICYKPNEYDIFHSVLCPIET